MADDISSSVRQALVAAVRAIAGGTKYRARGTGTWVRTDADGTGWVMLAGATEPTPVSGATTATASEGDTVQWELDGTTLTVTGNASAPAVGERDVTEALDPVVESVTALEGETTRAWTSIERNAEEIALKANQTTVDNLTGRMSSAEASITAQAGQIASKVSQTDYNGQTIASLINQSADTVTIEADHIDLDGAVTIGDLSSDAQAATLNSLVALTSTATGAVATTDGALAGSALQGATVTATEALGECSLVVSGKNHLPQGVPTFAVSRSKIVTGSAYRGMYCPIVGGQTYTVSRTTVQGNRFRIYSTVDEPAVGVSVTELVSSDGALSAMVTPAAGARWLFLYLANDSSTVDAGHVQVERGSTATAYADYGGSVTPIDLGGVTLAAGDTIDVASDGGVTATVSGASSALASVTVPTVPEGESHVWAMTDGGATVSVTCLTEYAAPVGTAAQTATSYITAVDGDGIWVTPSDAGPTDGAATSTTSGWHISDALELFRLGVSAFKVWADSTTTYVRAGIESGRHLLMDGASLSLMNASETLAKFSSSGIEFLNGVATLSAAEEVKDVSDDGVEAYIYSSIISIINTTSSALPSRSGVRATKERGVSVTSGTTEDTGSFAEIYANEGDEHDTKVSVSSNGNVVLRGRELYFDDLDRPEYDSDGNLLGYLGTGATAEQVCNILDGGKVLCTYDYSVSVSGTVTLDESAANYTRLLIEYRDSDGAYNSVTVDDPNGKDVCLMTTTATQSAIFLKSKTVHISGTSITCKYVNSTYYRHGQAAISSSPSYGTDELIGITKVLGFMPIWYEVE